jgi:hypothetical protein
VFRRFTDDGLVRTFRLAGWLLMIVALAGAADLARGRRDLTTALQLLGFIVLPYWAQVAADRRVARRLVELARSGALLGEPVDGGGRGDVFLAPYRSATGLRLLAGALAALMALTATAAAVALVS